ncbi:MAG TPA: glycosyltransferase family 4 protein [Candidatus Krumholzibacteria bacterium]|nr:glycosyltransferase family 4 protein [Candidatus Krumholzibacteria bacterium]
MKCILVITPWKRRWEMGNGAGVADDHYFIAGLRERGFDIHYLCPRDADPPPGDSRYTLHVFPNVLDATERFPSVIRRPLWLILFTACVVHYGLRVSKRFLPSVIVGQTHLSSIGVRILARRLHVPSIIKLFGVEELDRIDWSRLRYWRKNAEQILAFKVYHDAWIILDDGTAGDVAARRHGVAPERVHLLPNGVNTEWRDVVGSSTDLLDISPQTQVVLYLSRLTSWKQPDLFIRLAPLVLELVDKPVLFVLAGDGPFRSACQRLAGELGVASHVRFLGPVPHTRVPALMRRASVFAATNRRSNAGIPACEAMVCGIPVVAFDVGGTAAIVQDGRTGRLIPDGSIAAFARAIADLLNDTTTRERMGGQAAEFAAGHFMDWQTRVGLEAEIINGVIERRVDRAT